MPESSPSQPFIEALEAGLSPIPVDTGTKRPLVAWKTYQSEPADLLQCQEWAGQNIGVVCGQVSGRLVCLDFETAFMPQMNELVERLKADECYQTFYGWVGGYSEETARGGMHVLVRLEGEGPTEGNRKLAMASPTEVLIETRGEGGYAVVAPSMNGTRGWKLLHGGFSSIAYATLEEWEAVVTVLRTFDAAPPPPAPTVESRSTPPLSPMLRDSWIDEALARLPNIRTVLSSLGWEPAGDHDQYGEHWVRPGKDSRLGHSASISANDRLYVHSTNAGLPVGNPTLDALDIILFCDLGHRPSAAERVDYLRAQRSAAEPSAGAAVDGGPSVAELNLPAAFWTARPWLGGLREAAMLRGLAPAAVLGAFLSGYATTVPMGIWLPAVWGRRSPLNTYVALVARSGGGKTAAMGTALDLLGWNVNTNPHVLLSQAIRSGEGMVTLAVIPRRKDDAEDAPSFNNAVQVHFDEGGVLGKQVERIGSSTIPYLNTAWAGSGMVGGAKAGEVSQFPAYLVRICVVMGVQFGAAANLFTGESARLGFPQRLLYFGLEDAQLADLDVDSMEISDAKPLDVPFWAHSEFTRAPLLMDVPPDVVREVRRWTRDKDHGPGGVDPLDGHQMLLQLRTAALMALLDGRGAIDNQDWELSAHLVEYSRQIRTALVMSLHDVSQSASRARISEAVSTADALDDRWVRYRAVRLARHVHALEEPCSRKDLRKRLAGFEKPRFEEILDYAIAQGWIVRRNELFERGGNQPAA